MDNPRGTDILFERYLFERHSPDELRAWARSLRYFRFCRAYGGHSGDDGDQLMVALRIGSERELEGVFAQLQIPVRRLPPDNPEPQIGVAYTGAQYAEFKTGTPDFPRIQQPSHVTIAGQKAHAWMLKGQLQITIHDQLSPYDVTQEAVDSARQVEPLLAPLRARIIDPPRDNRNCVCPKFYPLFWAN
jgi:hypothetical protein